MKTTRILNVLAVASFVLNFGCSKRDENYESKVEINRISVARKDTERNPTSVDVEFGYVECTGTQIEVIRGGKNFAACMEKYKVGDTIPVKLHYFWSDDGHYDYEVFELGGCKRPPDPHDEASYRMIRECEPWSVHGTEVGFRCSMKPEKKLVEECPWFHRD